MQQHRSDNGGRKKNIVTTNSSDFAHDVLRQQNLAIMSRPQKTPPKLVFSLNRMPIYDASTGHSFLLDNSTPSVVEHDDALNASYSFPKRKPQQ